MNNRLYTHSKLIATLNVIKIAKNLEVTYKQLLPSFTLDQYTPQMSVCKYLF